MALPNNLPEFVLFGDSLTEWSFDEETKGFGLFLQRQYDGKVKIVNEGKAGYTSSDLESEFNRIIRRAASPLAPPTLLFTIFLGANDACLIGDGEFVPLPLFSLNIQNFVETILNQDALSSTKIILIAPPPINCQTSEHNKKEDRAYRTYMSKKRYAEKIMHIAAEYEETGRVVGLNYWGMLVERALEEEGRGTESGPEKYDEGRLPGCGLVGAKGFSKGWFTDGLHLDFKAYQVLSEALIRVVTEKWPELAPDQV